MPEDTPKRSGMSAGGAGAVMMVMPVRSAILPATGAATNTPTLQSPNISGVLAAAPADSPAPIP